ncbi:hypothetical protein KAN5_21370 [Pseudoalteromonas sp. KAN5]|nr:hypothetical protein KAN5_21370 [Pseudoalteromonas sp. KAN5]
MPVTGARKFVAIKKIPRIKIAEENTVRLVGAEYKTKVTKSMAGGVIIPEGEWRWY